MIAVAAADGRTLAEQLRHLVELFGVHVSIAVQVVHAERNLKVPFRRCKQRNNKIVNQQKGAVCVLTCDSLDMTVNRKT